MTGIGLLVGPRPRAVVLLSAAAIGLTATLLATLAVVHLHEEPAPTQLLASFRLGAAALFFAAGFQRVALWHLTHHSRTGILSAAVLVLGIVALPLDEVSVLLRSLLHAAGTLVCLVLAVHALTGSSSAPSAVPARTVTRPGPVLVHVGIALVVPLPWLAFVALSGPGVPRLAEVAMSLGLAFAWLLVGLLASRRDEAVSLAGRVAPLYGCLGVVELLLSLDHLRPGAWQLPAAALLASVAMVAAHWAYVDLVDGLRASSRTLLTPAMIAEPYQRTTVPALVDFEVLDAVASAAEHRAPGEEIRVRGEGGIARGCPTDFQVALETLLDNAQRYAPRSPVTVQVLAIGSVVEVSVADRGPGLTSGAAAVLLPGRTEAPVDPSSARGLHRARSLMRDHDGELELRSRIGGATFVLSLPASAALAHQQTRQQTRPGQPTRA